MVMAELDAVGVCTDFLDLAETGLPMCKSAADTDGHPGKRDLVERAQGFVLATPEYHNSYSGVLKNALDLLSSEQLGDKMFGLIGIAGGDMGTVGALNRAAPCGAGLHRPLCRCPRRRVDICCYFLRRQECQNNCHKRHGAGQDASPLTLEDPASRFDAMEACMDTCFDHLETRMDRVEASQQVHREQMQKILDL